MTDTLLICAFELCFYPPRSDFTSSPPPLVLPVYYIFIEAVPPGCVLIITFRYSYASCYSLYLCYTHLFLNCDSNTPITHPSIDTLHPHPNCFYHILPLSFSVRTRHVDEAHIPLPTGMSVGRLCFFLHTLPPPHATHPDTSTSMTLILPDHLPPSDASHDVLLSLRFVLDSSVLLQYSFFPFDMQCYDGNDP